MCTHVGKHVHVFCVSVLILELHTYTNALLTDTKKYKIIFAPPPQKREDKNRFMFVCLKAPCTVCVCDMAF